MNYCPLGHHFPDANLTCPTCAEVRGEAALREMQTEFLRKARSGEMNYTLRIAKGGDRHVLMYSTSTRTFCGRELKSKPQIGYEPYSIDTLSRVCAGCRVEIKRALEIS